MIRQNTSWPDAEELARVRAAAFRWMARQQRKGSASASLSAFIREACREKIERDRLDTRRKRADTEQ